MAQDNDTVTAKPISQLPEFSGTPDQLVIPGVHSGATHKANLGTLISQAIASDTTKANKTEVDTKFTQLSSKVGELEDKRISGNASIEEQIFDFSESTSHPESCSYVKITNKVITEAGQITGNNYYAISEPIYLGKSDKIVATNVTCTGAAVIALSDYVGNVKSVLVKGQSSASTYNYTAESDCYVMLCWREATQSPSVTIYRAEKSSKIDDIKQIALDYINTPCVIESGTINTSGVEASESTRARTKSTFALNKYASIQTSAGVHFSAKFYNGTSFVYGTNWVTDGLAHTMTDLCSSVFSSVRLVFRYSDDRAITSLDSLKESITLLTRNIDSVGQSIADANAGISQNAASIVSINSDIADINESLNGGVENITSSVEFNAVGNYMSETGLKASEYYQCTKPIHILGKSVLEITTLVTSNVIVIAEVDEEGTFKKSILKETVFQSADKTYSNIEVDGGYYVINRRTNSTSFNVTVKKVYEGFDGRIDAAESKIDSFKSEIADITGGERSVELTLNSGYIVNGVKSSSSSYSYSDPVKVNEGDTIYITSTGNGFDPISKTDANGTTYSRLVAQNDLSVPATSPKNFTYIVTEDCYVAICVKSSADYSVRFTSSGKLKSIESKIDSKTAPTNYVSNVGNVSIAAAKEHHYSDGTYPIIEWYLLRGVDEGSKAVGKFYWSKDLKNKKYIFSLEWARTYSYGILPNGDIIAVKMASSLTKPWTGSDSSRVNPIVFKASENWSTPHEVDFGTSLKPCGWLENCGFLAMPNGDTMFAEYTRISVHTCNVWKISGDPLVASNWNVVKSFTLSGQNDEGLKHLHAVQNDPFTGYIYISTGDYEASSIYVTKDNGATFEVVKENNEVMCRSLAITFTPDLVCWGNDSVNHVFIKTTRRTDGVADIDNAQVLNLPRITGCNAASYGQAYLPEYNAVLVLDRQDGGGGTTEMPLYIVELDNLQYKVCGYVKAVSANSLNVGFRTSFSEWYPRNGEIKIGFTFDTSQCNMNKGCGNAESTLGDGTETVNNLVLRVRKVGSNYTLSMETMFI